MSNEFSESNITGAKNPKSTPPWCILEKLPSGTRKFILFEVAGRFMKLSSKMSALNQWLTAPRLS